MFAMKKVFVLVAVVCLGGCAADVAVIESAKLDDSTVEAMMQPYIAEAEQLAGAPEDVAQRVVFLHEIYADSSGNFEFPEVAIHGALWADRFFRSSDWVVSLADEAKISELTLVDERLEHLRTELLTINRQVFIDTYSAYWFARDNFSAGGLNPALNGYFDPVFHNDLGLINQARTEGLYLPPDVRRRVYVRALEREQRMTVSEAVKDAFAKMPDDLLTKLIKRPIVQFEYFGLLHVFPFADFSDADERIHYAIRARDIGERRGWDRVFSSIDDYGSLPASFFDDPELYTNALRQRLLEVPESR